MRAAWLALAAAPLLAGCVSLHDAALRGDNSRVHALLSRGTDVNESTPERAPALIAAVVGNKPDTVRLLLQRGADPSKRNKAGSSALAFAAHRGYPAIADMLMAHGAKAEQPEADKSTPLLLAVRAGQVPTLKAMINRGAKLSGKEHGGVPPLHAALTLGRMDVVEALLAGGADPNEEDASGNTPVSMATFGNRPDLVRALVAAGARPIGVQGRVGFSVGAGKQGELLVHAVMPGSPAAGSGLKPGDRLLKINGESVLGLTSKQTVEKLRGEPGSKVDVEISRGAQTFNFVFTRESVGVPHAAPAPAAVAAAPPAAASPVPASAPKPSWSSDIDHPSARAAERPDDFALVIGIDEYQSLPKADFGVRDAQTVRRHLEAMGLPARNIVSLEGPGATASKLKSYLEEWLPLNVKPQSTLFVYYSGHGAPDPKTGEAYLVPWDGDPKFLKSTAYPVRTLYASLAKTKAKRVIVALDACFSGAGGRSVLPKGARPLVSKLEDDVPVEKRLTVLAAASGDEITGTLDEQGHGLFTYHLLKGLSGAAKSADGSVSARSLYDYLKPRVQDDARRQNREQTPALLGGSYDEPLTR